MPSPTSIVGSDLQAVRVAAEHHGVNPAGSTYQTDIGEPACLVNASSTSMSIGRKGPNRYFTPGGGPKGIRTPDLLAASQTLYQLSYGPGS